MSLNTKVVFSHVAKLFFQHLMLAVYALIVSFVVTQASYAQSVCFDIEQSNCPENDHFVNLRGNAPSHYKVYFDDRDTYLYENVFEQYEYLTDVLIQNLPTATLEYDYNRVYADLSRVTIFGHTPLVLDIESWGPYAGCCYSDEYSSFFEANSFVLSDAHEVFTKMYFCKIDQVSRSEFIDIWRNLNLETSIQLEPNIDNLIHIQCGRRLMSFYGETLSINFDKSIVK